ncbi:unnamed protein product [Linum tenue]|uniref:Cation-transporting P-type ATPase N-terminal domain-containing protein n=1 Tax=Linum tenue TaxID=586396 RepID=A0AAV0LAM5_9ROSI|nr:unnamed protein product [Linum tenue]
MDHFGLGTADDEIDLARAEYGRKPLKEDCLAVRPTRFLNETEQATQPTSSIGLSLGNEAMMEEERSSGSNRVGLTGIKRDNFGRMGCWMTGCKNGLNA